MTLVFFLSAIVHSCDWSFWTWHRTAWWSFSHQCMDKEADNSCPQQGCSGWQSFFRETTGNLYLCFSVHSLLFNCILFSLFVCCYLSVMATFFSSWSLSLAWISVCLVVWKVLTSLCVFILPQAAVRRWACNLVSWFFLLFYVLSLADNLFVALNVVTLFWCQLDTLY